LEVDSRTNDRGLGTIFAPAGFDAGQVDRANHLAIIEIDAQFLEESRQADQNLARINRQFGAAPKRILETFGNDGVTAFDGFSVVQPFAGITGTWSEIGKFP
jgi:hypothetical protein